MNVTRLEPRLFGVPSPEVVVAAGAVALLLATVLLLGGHWLAGPFFLAVGVLLLLVFASLARRFPDTPVARYTRAGLGGARRRTGIAAEVGTARLSSRFRIVGLGAALKRLAGVRRERVLELGEAVLASDRARTKTAKERVAEVESLMDKKRAEMAAIEEAASDRVRKARTEGRPTSAVSSQPLPRSGTARQAH